MAPRIAKGKVIIGNAGAEYPVRGYISAYDAETSKLAWRFYTVPGDPKKGFENKAMEDAAKTWSGEWWKFGGGGTVWDGMAFDPESNLFYFGTGNGGPWPSELRQSRGQDNLYVASVLAVDVDSGAYRWHYQFVPEDSWDYDSVQQLTLADIRIGNETRKVIMQANKNGFFYVLDRLTGKVISAEPYAQVNWASKIDLATGRPVVNPGAFYTITQAATIMPGAGGAHNWAPMAFNPITNLMYIPTSANSSGTYRVAEPFAYQAGRTNLGTNFGGGPRGGTPPAPGRGGIPGPPPAPAPAPTPAPVPAQAAAAALPVVGPIETGGWLVAIDPSTQKEKWRARGGGSIGGGALTTASNLVFQVRNDGHLIAFKADTGEQLVDLSTNQTIGMGPPITFMVDNKQYVAVAGGRGNVVGGRGGIGPPAPQPAANVVLPRVYVYTLDGKAVNPTPATPAAPATPPGGGGGTFGGGGR
jgi:quinohemoprotein ethanol dehydrogenase